MQIEPLSSPADKLEYVRRLEDVARAAFALRPIGSPVSINQMMRLERALKALTDGFALPADDHVGPERSAP